MSDIFITRNRRPVSPSHKLASTTGGRQYQCDYEGGLRFITDDNGELICVSRSMMKKFFSRAGV